MAGAVVFEMAENAGLEGNGKWENAIVWEHLSRLTQDDQGHQAYQPHKNCSILRRPCLVLRDEVAGLVLRQEWLQARMDQERIYERLEFIYAELQGPS
ncbi:hypothetical protein GCM10009733_021110 [Nonomuraea maheshkhaliensis]|uniref:Uncharacterized protein n=1 Tax=Nonomuraea maheshkhaliensis TaxID=419590 RepID=A0ABN2F0L3_9ACTN